MKIGAHVEIVGRNLPYEKAFPMLRRLGAQGVELVIRDGAPLHRLCADADFLRVRRLAADEGLAILGTTSGYSWSLSMTSSDPAVRRAGDEAMRRLIEGTALMGAQSMLIAPGYAKTDFVSPSEVVPVDTAIERAKAGVLRAARYAEDAHVSLNVEVVWNGMLRQPEEMRAFLDGIASPSVGFYLDTGNVYPQSDPLRWIELLGPYIRRVHMKDFAPEREGMQAFCPLGEGRVDFPAVLRALQAAGYDGWISAEHHVRRDEAAAKHSLDYLHALTHSVKQR